MNRKLSSMSFVLMLVVSTFAFAFMIGSEVKTVSATITYYSNGGPVTYAYDDNTKTTYVAASDHVWKKSGNQMTPDQITSTNGYNSVGTTSPIGSMPTTTATQATPDPGVSAVTPNTAAGSYTAAGLPSNAGSSLSVTTFNSGIYTSVDNNVYKWDASSSSWSKTTAMTSSDLSYGSTSQNTAQVNLEASNPNQKQVSGLQTGASVPPLGFSANGQAISTPASLQLKAGVDTYGFVDANTGKTMYIKSGDTFSVTPNSKTDGATITVNGKPYALSKEDYATFQEGKDNYDLSKVVTKGGFPPGTTYDPKTGFYTTPSGGIYNSANEWQGRGDVKTIFGTVGFGGAQLIQGVQWAAIAAGLVQTLGTVFGMDQAEVNAASAGIAAGIMAGKVSYALLGEGGYGGITENPGMFSRALGLENSWMSSAWFSAGVGVAAAWLVYNAMWSKTETSIETVAFSCLPWQAPHGGEDCELCNDPTLPCSEYRCKSLGQSCAIVNKGTKAEMCVNVNARDVSPPVIKPLNSAITEGFSYFDVKEMPPGAGFKIKSNATSTGCIPPFTPMQFGIQTNEPSQCKIDVEPKGNYSKMSSYFGGNNLYSYNHTEYLSLPSAKDFQNSSITLKNGKELTFYMRCIDASGNANEADYALTLCVDPSPDTTAPVIQGTSISNGGCISAKTENATVGFYVNEPAQCRWGFVDSDYDQMPNDMVCANSPVQVNALQSYTCNALLTGIVRDGTKFYARCKDQPQAGVNDSKRNKNMQSYMFTLRGSNELKLKTIQPNSTIYGMVNPSPVELYAETLFGCNDNKAICYYSTSDADNSFVQFFDTNNADGVSTQRLDLTAGLYTYFVKCVDAGGNLVKNSTTFNVNIDSNSPIIARTYEEDGYLKLVTAFNSDCVYTNSNCDYLFNEGTSMPYSNSTAHVTQWSEDKTYYIKCRDEYRSEPADCSLIVRPTENFL